MSKIGYEDYSYASEEEMNEEAFSEHTIDLDEEERPDDISYNGGFEDDGTDIDEYASFNTDLEKHQYDQTKWNGIQNARMYQKKEKGGPNKKANDNGKKSQKQLGSLNQSNRKRKRDPQTPTPKPTAKPPKDGEIHFDTTGALWYSYLKDGINISERATFHHWIRPALSRDEDAKGTYDFPRKRGPGSWDITCYNAIQQHWGLQRRHYAPIMFEWERLNRKDPDYQLGSLYYQGLLVLDYWRSPVRHFHEIPLVISSAFEGGYMEPATRLHSDIKYEDIRARMPPFIEVLKDGFLNVTPLSQSNTLCGRSRRFRENAGAIAWDKKRDGSAEIKVFIEKIVQPQNNSTRGSRDLTKIELKKLRLVGNGSKPARANPRSTQESKDKYAAYTRRAAGLDLEDEDDDEQETDIDDGEMTEAEDEDHSMLPGMTIAVSPRLIFIVIGSPFLDVMTEEEACVHPTVDHWDPRNHVPKSLYEIAAIRDALQVTIDHFKEIFGHEPIEHEGGNYVSEYSNIQAQMDHWIGDDATALRRLGPWLGSVFDGPDHNPFAKRFLRTLPELGSDSDATFRLETDEEQFRRHMESFREIEGMGKLPEDDGEEGETPPWGHIHFDRQGKLWYRELGRKKWERAVFHYWIRHELGAPFKNIPYVFPRERGIMTGDETCHCAYQRTWGTKREHYPDVMFQYSPPSERRPIERVGNLTFGGLVVIDFRLNPVKNCSDIPWVLSSKYEGDFMEPAMRHNSALTYYDFRARMPPIIREDKVLKPLYGPYDLVDRTGHFRKQAGAIAWNPNEDAGGKLSKYMDARLTRFLGDDRRPESIKSLPNLSPLETFDLHVFGSEGAPMNVKGTATTVLKEHHVESSERQAGLPTDTTMTDATDVNERSAESGPLAFPFCPYGEASNFGTRNGPSSAEDRLADFAWLDSTAKLNGQLLGYEPTDFSSHKFLYSRWNMIQRELYANWREDAVVDLSRRISELKRSGFGPFGQ